MLTYGWCIRAGHGNKNSDNSYKDVYVLCVCLCRCQGQFISEYVGELIDEQEAQRRLSEAYRSNVTNFYMMTLDSSRWVSASTIAFVSCVKFSEQHS